jgi:hypothetical protein
MATQRTLSTFTGEDKAIPFTVYQVGTLTAQNITSWTLSFSVKALATDDTAEFTKTTTAGIALTTPASGLCTVTIDAADTADLDEGVYAYELKRTDAGFERVLFYGRFRVTRSVH